MPSVADICDIYHREGNCDSLPPALLLFEEWPDDDNSGSFRTRAISTRSKGILDNARARVEWVRKRTDGVFSSLIGIGRTRNNDIVLPMGGVSKYHAYIQCSEDGVFTLADAGSKNGTSVGGDLLLPRTPTELTDGELILFAGHPCRFHLTAEFVAAVLGHELSAYD